MFVINCTTIRIKIKVSYVEYYLSMHCVDMPKDERVYNISNAKIVYDIMIYIYRFSQ